jgi:sugar lactone lactonase YvrE
MQTSIMGLTAFFIVTTSLFYSSYYETYEGIAQISQSNNETYGLAKEWDITNTDQSESEGPFDLAVGSANNVYVLDGFYNLIKKFDREGNLLTEWNTYGKEGYYDEDGSVSIAIDSFDDVYILDSTNWRIQKFDNEGNFIMTWGSPGTGDNQFSSPTDIAIDSKDNIYVSDAGNNRIQKFDKDGNLIGKFGVKGREDGQFLHPVGLAVDSSGNVYTLESQGAAGLASGNNRVQKFDSNGEFITKWGSLGKEDGQFESAISIDVDFEDNIYVGDTYEVMNYTSDYYDVNYYDRIQKFDSNGEFITKLELGESDYYPIDFSLDKAGNIYNFDVNSDMIQILSPHTNQLPKSKLNNTDTDFGINSDNKPATNEDYKVIPGITDQI